jgi:hypothetical protein
MSYQNADRFEAILAGFQMFDFGGVQYCFFSHHLAEPVSFDVFELHVFHSEPPPCGPDLVMQLILFGNRTSLEVFHVLRPGPTVSDLVESVAIAPARAQNFPSAILLDKSETETGWRSIDPGTRSDIH